MVRNETMDPNGSWLLLVGDEDLMPGRNRAISIEGAALICGKLILDVDAGSRLVLNQFDQHGMAGLMYRFTGEVPDGDPARLWRELEEAGDDRDPRWDELPICDPARLVPLEPAFMLPGFAMVPTPAKQWVAVGTLL